MKIERQTLAQQVLDRLVIRLMESNIKQGERVSTEQELMEEFGVSRSSVREAVKALQNLGILESRPALGTFLSPKNDTYSRLLLFASLLSSNTQKELNELVQALEFHSLSKLQDDIYSAKEEVQQEAQQHLQKLEELESELTQLRLQSPGSHEVLAKQREFLALLSSYPNCHSLIANISNNLEDFLAQSRGVQTQFSEKMMANYNKLIVAIRDSKEALFLCYSKQIQLAQDSNEQISSQNNNQVLETV